MNAVDGLAQSFSDQDRAEAKHIEHKISEITKVILAEKQSLDSNFVKLSQLIDEVRRKKYWLLGNYKTFGDYLTDCEKRFQIGHSQLYVGMKIVRNLLPSVSEEELVGIGISKAGVLSKYVEQSGQSVIPEDILEAAKTKKTDELDGLVNSRLHNVMPEQQGKWLALGGFYADEDEKQEILQAWELAKSIDPVIPNSIPSWRQLKEAQLRLAREFLSSWAGGEK